MMLHEFISELHRREIYIYAQDGRLHYQAVPGALTPELRSTLLAHKEGILDLLSRVSHEERTEAPPIRPVARNIALPLSYAQQRLWLLDQFEPGSVAYNMPHALRLTGALDIAALEQTMNEIVRRHETLRTGFTTQDGQPIQIVNPPSPISITYVDLKGCDKNRLHAEIQRLVQEDAQHPFNLATGPLLRVSLLVLGKEASDGGEPAYVLLFTMHHIASDGWSADILIRELAALYQAYLEGKPSPLPELPIQYADFAVWQRNELQGATLEKHLAYWRAQLKDAPPLLELPTDRPRPAVQKFQGANYPFSVSSMVSEQLLQLSQRNGTTLFMTLLAAFQLLLARHSGQQDICVGSPIANRTRVEIEGLIGFFVNTLVYRTNLSGNPRFTELLADVRNICLGAQAHQDLPFEKLVEELRPVRDVSYSPLFQTMLVLQNAQIQEIDVAGLQFSTLDADTATAKFDLSLLVTEQGNRLEAVIEYATDLFDRTTIVRLVEHFQILLASIVAQPDARLSELPMLAERERAQILYEWNATQADYPADICIHQLFEMHTELKPDAIALVYEDQTLSYGELNRKANQLAHYLRSRGVGSDTLVGLCVERSLEMVIGLLGILKAGGAYLPLDPDYPKERLSFMLNDAKPALLLTLAKLIDRLPGHLQHMRLDRDWPEIANENTWDPINQTAPNNLAYVIYTSGSTGKPKGVGVPHKGMLNRLLWMQEYFGLSGADTVLQKTPYSFDVSVWEFFWPLMTGARLAIAEPDDHKDPKRLASLIETHNVTTIHFVPSMLQAFLDGATLERCSSLKHVVCSGEALSADLQQRFFQRCAGKLYNLYGPTEASIDVTAWDCVAEKNNGCIPIGKPIANTQTYILDSSFSPTPVGVSGELYLAGVQLARGYINRPELTAERFVPHPFSARPGERLYKTGDLARYRTDGNIEYLGRIDHQVKIRGFRIELGEIEAQLLTHPSIKEAVVLAREDHNGGKRLLAYVAGTDAAPEADTLRYYLQGVLPDYMVPAAFITLETLPLTPNGKLDRKALPDPDFSTQLVKQYVAPSNAIEEQLAAIWAEVLGLERVGIHDNFFELGGHSLLAIALIERMRRQGLSIEAKTLFSAPTVAELATTARKKNRVIEIPPNRIPAQCETITPEMLPLVTLSQAEIEHIVAQVPGRAGNIQDIYPLAPLQEGILFHHMMSTERDVYLLTSMLAFDTGERMNDFENALQIAVNRHDILRTAVIWEDVREPVQVVWREASVPIEEVTLDAGEHGAVEQLRAHFNSNYRRYRLDVRQAPLLRIICAYDVEHDRWLLLLIHHHLAIDHTAIDVLLAELQTHLLRQSDRLPVPLPFRNFVMQARLGVSREEHEAFFRKMLNDIDEPTAPFGLLNVQGDGTDIKEASLPLETGLAGRLRNCARALGVTAASLFHLAWAQVLARASGREDVVFGTVLFGRMQGDEGAAHALGIFINTLPVRIRLGEASAKKSVRSTHALLAELLQHEHASLALAQRCSGVPAPTPLFSALLNYRHSPQDAPDASVEAAPAWEGIEALICEERTNYPFILSVDDLGNGFELSAQVQTPIEPQRICEYMRTALTALVDALETAPETAMRSIEILPEPERHQLLAEWNVTNTDYPRNQCIHRIFEEQAERNPKAIALAYEDQMLSYGDLNTKANQLSHHLQRLGVGPDTIVGLCVERSPEMIIGLLGILKAGGAYLPLDPDYPKQRLSFMLDDAKPELLLTLASLRDNLPKHLQRICLDRDWPEIANESTRNPMNRAAPSNLAYVIYTSGSTGKPKGVLVTHRSVVRLVKDSNYFNIGPEEVFLQFAPLAFDASTFEIWGGLLNCATLALAPKSEINALERLGETIQRYRVTSLWLTAALFHQVVDQQIDALNGVRQLLAGGDVLSVPHVLKLCETFPQCKLINGYGPTENTTFSTTARIHAPRIGTNAPIGKPVANSIAYVLDKNMDLAPIGVAGELYVGGDGLARGYLNQPHKTACAFIPNPYSEEPGTRLYSTGDLARWRTDGEIEFLGRIDNQVKVRGFRIELAEIETRLVEHPEISEAAVITGYDNIGEKRLIAYITPAVPTSGSDRVQGVPESLRAFLGETLPAYMIPSSLVMLEQFPLNPNGKLDRNALPALNLSLQTGHHYVAPRTVVEEQLAQIWMEVLGINSVSIHDNFFELGGHSLLATRLLFRIKESFGAKIGLSSLFDAPTLETQSRLLECKNENHGSPAHRKIDFVAEGCLEASIHPSSSMMGNTTDPSAVLLTGATGFLGAFLLYEYLQQTQATIYCLVRSPSTTEASARIEQTLMYYRLWDSAFKKRILPVCGDLAKPLLGLSSEIWQHLAQEIDIICHNGAWVNFVHPYSTLKPANVLGTQELLRLACAQKTKPFHYVSTAGVFGNSIATQRPAYTETDDLPMDAIINGGYCQSKRVAEHLVKTASARGLPISIHRPSFIVGDSASGTCNADDFFFRILRGYISLGKAPKMEEMLDLVTVDYVSQAIVWLSKRIESTGNVFHLTNSVEIPLSTLLDWTNALGYRVDIIPESDWKSELYDAMQNNEEHPLFPLYSLLERSFRVESTSPEYTPRIDCQYTLNQLAESGIACPNITPLIWEMHLAWLKQVSLNI